MTPTEPRPPTEQVTTREHPKVTSMAPKFPMAQVTPRVLPTEQGTTPEHPKATLMVRVLRTVPVTVRARPMEQVMTPEHPKATPMVRALRTVPVTVRVRPMVPVTIREHRKVMEKAPANPLDHPKAQSLPMVLPMTVVFPMDQLRGLLKRVAGTNPYAGPQVLVRDPEGQTVLLTEALFPAVTNPARLRREPMLMTIAHPDLQSGPRSEMLRRTNVRRPVIPVTARNGRQEQVSVCRL